MPGLSIILAIILNEINEPENSHLWLWPKIFLHLFLFLGIMFQGQVAQAEVTHKSMKTRGTRCCHFQQIQMCLFCIMYKSQEPASKQNFPQCIAYTKIETCALVTYDSAHVLSKQIPIRGTAFSFCLIQLNIQCPSIAQNFHQFIVPHVIIRRSFKKTCWVADVYSTKLLSHHTANNKCTKNQIMPPTGFCPGTMNIHVINSSTISELFCLGEKCHFVFPLTILNLNVCAGLGHTLKAFFFLKKSQKQSQSFVYLYNITQKISTVQKRQITQPRKSKQC